MAETSDYDPGPWKGYDFKSARKKFDADAGRAYADAVDSDKQITDLVPEKLTTDSEAPVVIVCDVTGSMGDWPATIFSKLPYLDIEGKEYLGDSMEVSFGAIGDCHCDKYPLQVYPFVKGKEMEANLKKMIIEGGGGGNEGESYDLAALYYARNVEMPNAIKPLFIIIGDEPLYKTVYRSKSESWARTKIEESMSVKEAFDELMKKYSCYHIHRGSGDDVEDSTENWLDVFPKDRVILLPEAGRVVDTIFGIFARETNKVDYFKKELADRQSPDQVKTVMKSLKTIHLADEVVNLVDRTDGGKNKSAKKLPAGASVTHNKSGGKAAKSLLDDK